MASALTLLNNLQVYTVHLWRFLCLECCSNKVVLFLKLVFWVSYLHVYFLPMVCDVVGYQYGHIQNVIGNLKNYGWYQDIFVAKNLVFFLKKYLWKGNRELVWRSPARTREGYFRIPQLLPTSWCDTTPLPQHQWQLEILKNYTLVINHCKSKTLSGKIFFVRLQTVYELVFVSKINLLI